jgi:dihydroorotase
MSEQTNTNDRKATVSESAGWVIAGGLVVDRTGERVADVAVRPNGTIAAVGTALDLNALGLANAPVINANGCIVAPGFVDIHTHLREPGREEAETVETGSRAAALGGYTAVVAMPNTEPTIDSVAVVRQVLDAGVAAGLCDVRSSGSITIGREGASYVGKCF